MNTETMRKMGEGLQLVAQIDILETILSVPDSEQINRQLIENLLYLLRQELKSSQSPFVKSKLEEEKK